MENTIRTPKEHIEDIIGKTFETIQDAYDYQTESNPKLDDPRRKKLSRIIFPRKRKEPIRVSEQELRFVFVEQLNNEINKGWDVYYSVETPTKDLYSGFKNKKDTKPKRDEHGRSGEFDLVIFDNSLKRIALIEFKANNASLHEHKKDFVKLNNEKEGDENVLRYFIEITKTYENETLSNLHGKTEGNEHMFRCWSLAERRDITNEICLAPIKKNNH